MHLTVFQQHVQTVSFMLKPLSNIFRSTVLYFPLELQTAIPSTGKQGELPQLKRLSLTTPKLAVLPALGNREKDIGLTDEGISCFHII